MGTPRGNTIVSYVFAYVVGVVFAGVGFKAVSEKAKYTPVYKDILLAYDPPVIENFHLGTILKDIKDSVVDQVGSAFDQIIPDNPVTGILGDIAANALNGPFSGSGAAAGGNAALGNEDAPNLRLSMKVTLFNPNVYGIKVSPQKPGVGYLQNRDIEAAEVVVGPIELTASPDGVEYTVSDTQIVVTTSIELAEYQSTLFGLINQGALQVALLFEYEMDVTVELTVMFWPMSFTVPSKQRCKAGINFFANVMGGSILGDTECADTWAELGVQRRLADAMEHGTEAPRSARSLQSAKIENAVPVMVQRSKVAEAQEQVNTGLTALIAACFIGAVCAFAGPPLHFVKEMGKKKDAPVGPEQEQEEEPQPEDDGNLEETMSQHSQQDNDAERRESSGTPPQQHPNSATGRGSRGSAATPPSWQQYPINPHGPHGGYKASATE